MSSGAAVERRLDRGVVGIDEQPDPPHRRWHLGAQSGGARRRHGTRARRVEDKAEIGRAALDGGGDRFLARQPADLGGDAHARDMVLRRREARAAPRGSTFRDKRGAPGRRPSGRGAGLRARRGRFRAHSRNRRIRAPRRRAARPSRIVSPSSWCNAAMRSKIRSAIVGASPIDGSSSSNRRGAEAMPRPIATICCSPPDSVPAIWPRRSASTGNSVKMRSRLRRHSARPRSA